VTISLIDCHLFNYLQGSSAGLANSLLLYTDNIRNWIALL